MNHEHWFDRLNKVLVGATPRRTLLGAGAALVASLALGAVPVAEAAKNRKNGKRKGKGKGKGKDKPNQPPPCSGGACLAEPAWAGNETEIGYCETKCGRCQEAGTPFCIHDPDDEHLVVHATCCPRGDECCGRECCGPPHTCCHDPRGGSVCVRGIVDCCPDDPVGWCSPETEICCLGVGCVKGNACPDPGCSDDRPTRCGRECVNTEEDGRHCGGCGKDCLAGVECCEEQCCGGGDYPKALFRCCQGRCVNWATDNNNCGIYCESCPAERSMCCAGRCFDPSHWTCCPDGITLCEKSDFLPWGCRQADTPTGWTCGLF